ncbi:helicase-associated domain-containing protein [Actinoplanes sp. NPDC051851]|uniref:helicase-associated domain-containing protein n=1 Tax=Actinoplanes sp. NPDC051851 TaxID=3154753 RepID=UPI003427D530
MAEQMAEFVRPTERYAADDVHAVLRLCDSGRLRCSEKTRRPAAATVVEIAKVLSAGDFYPDEPIAAFAWPLLVQAGGLAEITGGKLQLTAKGRAALDKPAAGIVRALWRSWLTRGLIDEFSRVENIKGQRAANVLTAPKARRQKVSEALAAQPADEWVEVDDLFGRMKQTAWSPRVARSERALWKLYLEDPQYGSLGYAGFGDWELLEGRYTLAVLFEYAATLGLIDVAYDKPAGARDDYHQNWGADYVDALSRYDGLRAIRLNGLGAYVLGIHEQYTPPEPEAPGRTVKVLPNLDIVAVGSLTPAEMLILESYAQRTGDHVWTVSRTTLLAAVDAGRQPGDLRVFLTARAAQPELPGTLSTLLDEITERAGRLTDLGQVRLIECADPALATLISHDRKLRTLCKLIGDRHLAVSVDREPDFRRALTTLGYAVSPGVVRRTG